MKAAELKRNDLVRSISSKHKRKTFVVQRISGDDVYCLYNVGDAKRHYTIVTKACRLVKVGEAEESKPAQVEIQEADGATYDGNTLKVWSNGWLIDSFVRTSEQSTLAFLDGIELIFKTLYNMDLYDVRIWAVRNGYLKF